MQTLLNRQNWSGLPLHALGGSSGGALVLLLALRMQVQVSHLCCVSLLAVRRAFHGGGRKQKQAENKHGAGDTAWVHSHLGKHIASARTFFPVHITWTKRCVHTAQHLCVICNQKQSHVHLILLYASAVYHYAARCDMLPNTLGSCSSTHMCGAGIRFPSVKQS